LSIFKAVEKRAGRECGFANAPRTLDLDLVFWADRIVRESGLRVPHPRWKERSFVVGPLKELYPGFRDPETGLTVQEVARTWSLEPREIDVVMTGEEFTEIVERERRGLGGMQTFSSPGRHNEE
jgi:7,8-dihydro-6-hydroxymethylpterin-pyrophosphokinase